MPTLHLHYESTEEDSGTDLVNGFGSISVHRQVARPRRRTRVAQLRSRSRGFLSWTRRRSLRAGAVVPSVSSAMRSEKEPVM